MQMSHSSAKLPSPGIASKWRQHETGRRWSAPLEGPVDVLTVAPASIAAWPNPDRHHEAMGDLAATTFTLLISSLPLASMQALAKRSIWTQACIQESRAGSQVTENICWWERPA